MFYLFNFLQFCTYMLIDYFNDQFKQVGPGAIKDWNGLRTNQIN